MSVHHKTWRRESHKIPSPRVLPTRRMSIGVSVAICYLLSSANVDELSARFSQSLHEVPGALFDVCKAIVRMEEFGTEAEARRAYAKPTRDILSFDTTHGNHPDIARQNGAER